MESKSEAIPLTTIQMSVKLRIPDQSDFWTLLMVNTTLRNSLTPRIPLSIRIRKKEKGIRWVHRSQGL